MESRFAKERRNILRNDKYSYNDLNSCERFQYIDHINSTYVSMDSWEKNEMIFD